MPAVTLLSQLYHTPYTVLVTATDLEEIFPEDQQQLKFFQRHINYVSLHCSFMAKNIHRIMQDPSSANSKDL